MYSMTNIVNIAVKLYMKIVERQTSFTLVKKEKELLFNCEPVWDDVH